MLSRVPKTCMQVAAMVSIHPSLFDLHKFAKHILNGTVKSLGFHLSEDEKIVFLFLSITIKAHISLKSTDSNCLP